MESSPVVVMRSRKSLAQVQRDLETACQEHGFGVLGGHDLQARMAAKGVPLDFACQVLDVCNPQQAKHVLDANRLVSAVLPCRISLYENPDGGTTLAMVAPTQLVLLFDEPSLSGVAAEVEASLRAILAQAAG